MPVNDRQAMRDDDEQEGEAQNGSSSAPSSFV